MRVIVAAIAHFDPLCRGRLHAWLQILLRTQSSPPGFVAVEWDKDIFAAVKSQRPTVRQIAQSRWPQATPEFLDCLESAVAFEADTHASLAPEVDTLWLDHGRSLPYSDAIDSYAVDRVEVYASYIPPAAVTFDSALLKVMSVEAWNRLGAIQEGGTDRDPLFAQSIAKHPSRSVAEWAVAIVGARHASRDDGYMVQRLEAEGFTCEVTNLRPSPDAA